MEYASSAFRDVCIQAALELAQADALAAAQMPEFVPSARFTRRMRRLLPHVKKNKYRSLTTAARVALVAALLALLALSAVAARHYGFSLFNFGTNGLFGLEERNNMQMEPLTFGYIPEGFVLAKEKYEKWGYAYANFTNEQGLMISISKQSTYETISVNTENKTIYSVEKDGIEYSIIVSLERTSIYWIDSDDGTLYEIIGPFDAEILLKIAEDVR